jgi:DNA-binding MarR family transcriptional regulator
MYLRRYILPNMDGVRLHRLGKRLIDLSREVTTSAGDASLTPAEIAVIEDALKNPGSPVSEIKARTGFAQSHVSESVARLKERGLIETFADPRDRRRTRVRLSETARQAVLARAGRDADDVIARAIADRERAERASALLDELAELLL